MEYLKQSQRYPELVYSNHAVYTTALLSLQLKIFECSHCDQTYTRKYRLSEHMKSKHGITDQDDCTRNFVCPFTCEIRYRTNTELLAHCDEVHQHALGKQY